MLGAAAATPLAMALGRGARALDPTGRAQRVIFFYFPDGVGGLSQDGEASLWSAQDEGGDVRLSELLAPLGDRKRHCVFLNGLSMGTVDEGSHPGGAKKLLTGVDGGDGMSIDQFLAGTAGADAPHRLLYLGAMANADGASGDKHISYPSAGYTTPPEDDPREAFRRVFGAALPSGGGAMPDPGVAAAKRSVIDTAIADLGELRTRLDGFEQDRLDLHLDALREVEMRLDGLPPAMTATCDEPAAPGGVDGTHLYDPAHFPLILHAQMDLMVQAMACGATRVGVIQASHHTSELIMSRFEGTEMYDPGFDMRSHQASHYGARHDRTNRLFTDFLKQRRWFVEQLAYLIDQLQARPEGDAGETMLDHSLVLVCSEVSDGNTHSHQDMPFVLAGRAGGSIGTGRVLDYRGRRHGDLLSSIAHAMGQPVMGYGTGSHEPLPGLLS
jgi:hypothetical protein